MLAPTQTPPLTWMLADIPHDDKQIARYLGVTLRSIQRYRKTNKAPTAIYRALFWETRYGRSAIHTHAQNEADRWRQYAKALERQIDVLRDQIKLLESMRQDVAANTPIFKVG
ncbi:hypothetical protein E9531_15085 [Lampropedia puyangensis]|uniref:Uncharacterized protein n=1 Tax=Lampropedia puyangensis TaxID=1330072 RepID=A0A4S8EZ97_9BURK|nr:hypothetical protein E9531_15085 [Lampropedia puyangensis]